MHSANSTFDSSEGTAYIARTSAETTAIRDAEIADAEGFRDMLLNIADDLANHSELNVTTLETELTSLASTNGTPWAYLGRDKAIARRNLLVNLNNSESSYLETTHNSRATFTTSESNAWHVRENAFAQSVVTFQNDINNAEENLISAESTSIQTGISIGITSFRNSSTDSTPSLNASSDASTSNPIAIAAPDNTSPLGGESLNEENIELPFGISPQQAASLAAPAFTNAFDLFASAGNALELVDIDAFYSTIVNPNDGTYSLTALNQLLTLTGTLDEAVDKTTGIAYKVSTIHESNEEFLETAVADASGKIKLTPLQRLEYQLGPTTAMIRHHEETYYRYLRAYQKSVAEADHLEAKVKSLRKRDSELRKRLKIAEANRLDLRYWERALIEAELAASPLSNYAQIIKETGKQLTDLYLKRHSLATQISEIWSLQPPRIFQNRLALKELEISDGIYLRRGQLPNEVYVHVENADGDWIATLRYKTTGAGWDGDRDRVLALAKKLHDTSHAKEAAKVLHEGFANGIETGVLVASDFVDVAHSIKEFWEKPSWGNAGRTGLAALPFVTSKMGKADEFLESGGRGSKAGWTEEYGAGYDKIKWGKSGDDVAFGLTRAERIRLVRNRPPRYRKGVVDEVWENAKGPDGRVFDPNTGKELFWDKTRNRDGQWEMGHKRGKSYDELKKDFIDGKISRKQFLDEYHNPANYRPEARSANRSRRYD